MKMGGYPVSRSVLPGARQAGLTLLLALSMAALQVWAKPYDPPSVTSIPSHPPKTHALSYPRNDVPGLPNFARVSEVLYRGAQPDREGFRHLRNLGIRTVVNLRDHHSDEADLKGLGFRYVNIPCKASEPEASKVVAFLKVVTSPQDQPVYVHCLHGSDRTGMMVACYRIVILGWSKDRAVAELSNFGFHNIWKNIRSFLRDMDPIAMVDDLAHATATPVETVP